MFRLRASQHLRGPSLKSALTICTGLSKTLAPRTSATHLSLVSRIRPITWIGAWWVEASDRGGPWPQLVIPESAQWLGMSIQEARERREGEAQIPARLPRALEETHRHLAECVEAYAGAFGPESADIHLQTSKIRITVLDEQDGKWQQRAKVEVSIIASLPGFRIERGGEPLMIEVGLLPGDKLFYRDQDEFLTMEELTRRTLDRAFFPKLGE